MTTGTSVDEASVIIVIEHVKEVSNMPDTVDLALTYELERLDYIKV